MTLLNLRGAARYLAITPDELRRLWQDRAVPAACMLPRAPMFDVDDLDAFAQEHGIRREYRIHGERVVVVDDERASDIVARIGGDSW